MTTAAEQSSYDTARSMADAALAHYERFPSVPWAVILRDMATNCAVTAPISSEARDAWWSAIVAPTPEALVLAIRDALAHH